MLADVGKILTGIQKVMGKAARNEAEAVVLALELGRRFKELKEAVPRRGLEELNKLGFNERVARRYLKLAEEWTPDRTPGSDLLARLPHDLQKLEWLCRLSLQQLGAICLVLDCRKA